MISGTIAALAAEEQEPAQEVGGNEGVASNQLVGPAADCAIARRQMGE